MSKAEKRRSQPDGGDAAYENRFAKIEQDLAVLKTDMTAIKWMIGVNLAASISIVIKVFG
jgi:hypothetical protein